MGILGAVIVDGPNKGKTIGECMQECVDGKRPWPEGSGTGKPDLSFIEAHQNKIAEAWVWPRGRRGKK